MHMANLSATKIFTIVIVLAFEISDAFAETQPSQLIQRSEQAMYAADFDAATRELNEALSSQKLDPDIRLALLLQQLRVQQNARLAGVIVGNEVAAVAEVNALLKETSDRDLQGQAALRLTVSRYFDRLLADEISELQTLAPEFAAAARQIESSCRRAEALFFEALMPQIAGKVAQSKRGLQAARAAAKDCPLEQTYIDRHLAAVAEDAGDLATALQLAARSTAQRRRIGFRIFLPFSLLLEADLEQKNRNGARARALLLEAAEMSGQLRLPAAQQASCASLAAAAIASPRC